MAHTHSMLTFYFAKTIFNYTHYYKAAKVYHTIVRAVVLPSMHIKFLAFNPDSQLINPIYSQLDFFLQLFLLALQPLDLQRSSQKFS